MKKTIGCLILILFISCNKQNKAEDNVTELMIESQDSTVYNEPKTNHLPKAIEGVNFISSKSFVADSLIRHTIFEYDIDRYNKILEEQNLYYKGIDSLGYSMTDDLTLYLKPLRNKGNTQKKESIHFMLYSKYKNSVQDSLLYYKYEIDPKFDEQRNEVISNLNGFSIYQLETTSSQEETGWMNIDRWIEYNIDINSGKIDIKHTYYNIVNNKYDYTIFKEYNPDIVGIYTADYNGIELHFIFQGKTVDITVDRENSVVKSGRYEVERIEKHDPNNGLDIKWILTKGSDKMIIRNLSDFYFIQCTPSDDWHRMDE